MDFPDRNEVRLMRVDVSGLDEVLASLKEATKKSNMVDACIRAVDKAAPILKKNLKTEIHEAANRGYATGALEGSIKIRKAEENEYGVFSVVGPQGTDNNGVENGDKLLYLENGTMREGYNLMRRAGPIRHRAVWASRAQCEAVMEQEIESKIDKIFGG